MTPVGLTQILVILAAVLLLTKPLGGYMARVFTGERTFLHPVLRPVERLFYKLLGIDEEQDMRWTTYSSAVLMFSVAGALFTYVLLRLQGHLPLDPQHFGGTEMTPDLSFNTAVSFATNTNWQNYSPESSISYLSNMVALATHNWMSAATGIAVAMAIVRGFTRRSVGGLGNFWVDMTRAALYVLLPICLVLSLVLVQQGVPQNFSPYVQATTVEGARQTIPQGPVASQECIKVLGTNGGGFFGANSSHPYENPTPLSNALEIASILLIGTSLTYTFGKLVGNVRQGWALLAAMGLLYFAGLFVCYGAEQHGNPNVARLGVRADATSDQPGGNMEGKEVRFGIAGSSLFAATTTATSCGAVNSMHDSYTPIGGLVLLGNMMCDEVIVGGVGAGLFGMLMYAVIAVFIAGLMVGRTPEYLGKKIERFEVRMAILAVLILAADVLLFTSAASSLSLPPGNPVTIASGNSRENARLMASAAAWNHLNNSSPSVFLGATWNNATNRGPHGFTEILYSYVSQVGNNGSAYAGFLGNTRYYNLTGGLAMLIGRFLMIVPLLAMAGSLARKHTVPVSSGTLHTDSLTFVVMLAIIVPLVGALEYFPALALGPIAEHLNMLAGHLV